MRRLVLICMLLSLGACAYPVERTRVVDEHPAILVRGAPPGAVLTVDGLLAGPVTDQSGAPQAIRIEPGAHDLAVSANGAVLLRQRVFVDGGIVKSITVPGGAIGR